MHNSCPSKFLINFSNLPTLPPGRRHFICWFPVLFVPFTFSYSYQNVPCWGCPHAEAGDEIPQWSYSSFPQFSISQSGSSDLGFWLSVQRQWVDPAWTQMNDSFPSCAWIQTPHSDFKKPFPRYDESTLCLLVNNQIRLHCISFVSQTEQGSWWVLWEGPCRVKVEQRMPGT